ncbi:MAG: M20 family peptidase [Nitrospinota bacterium]|nr:MAG: M20 family peptidase [Nitrospinota bacterium]
MEQQVIEELTRLVAMQSESGQEEAILAYLESRLRSLGFPPVRQPVAAGRYNLIWTPTSPPSLLFTAHVDTVPLWEHTHLAQPRLDGGRLYGRGSVDIKAGIAAILLALETVRSEGISPRFAVAFTVDEEQQGLGSRALPEMVQAGGAVVLEPTGLKICPAEAGSIEVRITIRGKAVHGSVFERGHNPILQAASLIESFKGLRFLQAEHPLIGAGGFNVMGIKGGGEALLVPERCELAVDFRLLPGQDVEEAKQELRQLLDQENITTEFIDVSLPFELSTEEPVVQVLQRAYQKALGRPPLLGGMPSWTDAEYLLAGGIPSVVFGPGDLAVAHTAWEHVEIQSVVDTVKVLSQAMVEASLTPP